MASQAPIGFPQTPHVSLFKLGDISRDEAADYIEKANQILQEQSVQFKTKFGVEKGKNGGVFSALYPDDGGIRLIESFVDGVVKQMKGLSPGSRTTSTWQSKYHITMDQHLSNDEHMDIAKQFDMIQKETTVALKDSTPRTRSRKRGSRAKKHIDVSAQATGSILSANQLESYGRQYDRGYMEMMGHEGKRMERNTYEITGIQRFGGWIGAIVQQVH